MEEEEEENGQQEVGGVWVVASVDEQSTRRSKTRFCDSFGRGNGRECGDETCGNKCAKKAECDRAIEGPPGLNRMGPQPRTLSAWMPSKMELTNRFNIFQVEEDNDEDEPINQVEEEVNEVVEITVDSGAARSVWPRRKRE